MKKILKILGICFFVLTLGYSGQVFAIENTNGYDELYFEKGDTKILDYEVEYIKNNYKNMFSSDDFTEKNNSEFTICEPIVIYSIDKGVYLDNSYPVFYNGKCIGLIKVFEDLKGKLTWQRDIGGIFLDKLNELRGKSGLYRIEIKETTGAPKINFVRVTNKDRSFNDDIVNFSKEIFKVSKEDIISREVESINKDKIEAEKEKNYFSDYDNSIILSEDYKKYISDYCVQFRQPISFGLFWKNLNTN